MGFVTVSCNNKKHEQKVANPVDNIKQMDKKITLMTLDPGHFHAALVQKSMYSEIDSTVYVYAPKGTDLQDHLNRIEGFNSRANNPTQWIEKIYEGEDYLNKMITEKPGNVMVVSGKNDKKIEYIKNAIESGINVFADKPMVINKEGFEQLEAIFNVAKEKDLLVYDIMTERFEITTIIQRTLSMNQSIFGELIKGSPEKPAITKESVHHFFKYVSGKPLNRPEWFFDTKQRGEGLNDVSTHLVDLVQWEAFPGQILKKSDIEIYDAKHWKTNLTLDQFNKVTGSNSFPIFLEKDIKDGKLGIYCNGSIHYKIKGKHAKTSVTWNFQAPEGTGDTHYSIMRGTHCDLIIKQGLEENYKPKLYVSLDSETNSEQFENKLKNVIKTELSGQYAGIKLEKVSDKLWVVDIPDKFKIGHEAHFGQVTKNYLEYIKNGNMPDWEIPNMIVKYYTTTQASKLANKN